MQALFRHGRTGWAIDGRGVGDRDRGEQAPCAAQRARDEHGGPESGGEGVVALGSRDSGTCRAPSTTTSAAIGTLMKKIHRQDATEIR
jgi:hypothetical protein